MMAFGFKTFAIQASLNVTECFVSAAPPAAPLMPLRMSTAPNQSRYAVPKNFNTAKLAGDEMSTAVIPSPIKTAWVYMPKAVPVSVLKSPL
ncbi:hypothetical protein D3C78_1054700 [compost metagenome]